MSHEFITKNSTSYIYDSFKFRVTTMGTLLENGHRDKGSCDFMIRVLLKLHSIRMTFIKIYKTRLAYIRHNRNLPFSLSQGIVKLHVSWLIKSYTFGFTQHKNKLPIKNVDRKEFPSFWIFLNWCMRLKR